MVVLRPVLLLLLAFGLVKLVCRFLACGFGGPLWLIPLGFAIGAEWIVRSYRRQGSAEGRRRVMLGIRLGILALLGWMILQPTDVRMVPREIQREVVVLVDESASMRLIDTGESRTRLEQGRSLFEQGKLADAITVRELRVARSLLPAGDETPEGWAQATDLAQALEGVLEQSDPDALSGLVLISDGRHNRPGSVEELARRFGIQDVPVAVIASGSEVAPRDISLLSVDAPDAVYLGDRLKVKVVVKADGYRGGTAKVRLLAQGQVVEEQTLAIPREKHREEIHFRHLPEQEGVNDYRVEIEALEGERFPENNRWEFQTVISDARTNVLLVDRSPRWEFRYLRNLFYGRDKSIHLQWVLVEPDRVVGQQDLAVRASATRPFGESQATVLPEEASAWRDFDVVILGDLEPSSIRDETWKIIRQCVEQRGALLVLIAGPRYLPHAIENADARALFPVKVEATNRTYFSSDEEFRFTLTQSGKHHPVLEQADGVTRSERVWSGFPPLRWRHPVEAVKEGAEVLLKAGGLAGPKVVASQDELGEALASVARRRETEVKNALLVTRQTGNGKVAMLLTDRTWRLREGVGDLYHHRFWGQLVRWGAGPSLRSGNQQERLGTARLTYTVTDQIIVQHRLRDQELNPINDAEPAVNVFHDGQLIGSAFLRYQSGSNGFYEGEIGPYTQVGSYEIRLSGSTVATGFQVKGSIDGGELSETTLNRALLEDVARLSGGVMVHAENVNSLASLFLKGEDSRQELRETRLWNHWLVLALLLGLTSAEWIMRRRGGLP